MLESLSLLQLIAAFCILIIAYVLRGITGFGSGLIAIPLLALMLPISVVVPMVSILDYTASLTHGMKHRSNIQWRQILPLLPFTLSGILLALYLFNTLDARLLKQFLGAFLIIYALYSLYTVKLPVHRSLLWAVPGGMFGGLISTLFGTGGPFYVIYFQLHGLGKAAFRATIATILLLDGTTRIIAYYINDFYTRDTLILIAAGFPVMAVSLYAGGHIHTSISHQAIQKGIGILLLISGGALLFK